jgi:aryl-alcohol dehydrogenase-like predicted oxidoreductase
MLYKSFGDLQLSCLGMGNMRLPTLGERGPIDEKKAREIIEYAYRHGVNYFDTAYGYHNGKSEQVVGEVLSQYPRHTWLQQRATGIGWLPHRSKNQLPGGNIREAARKMRCRLFRLLPAAQPLRDFVCHVYGW